MKNMKKLILFLLAAVMVFFLGVCAGQKAAGRKINRGIAV
jgi:hypothetical protein